MERQVRVPRRSSLDAISNRGYHQVSFSSSLLDTIYRSLDDDNASAGGHCERRGTGGGAVAGGGTTGEQPHRVSAHAAAPRRHNDPMARFPGDECFLATVERKERTTVTEKVVFQRRQHHGSIADEQSQRQRRHCIVTQQRQQRDRMFFSNSTTSSSDSCYGEFSSESESVILSAAPRPKTIRVGEPPAVRSSEQSTPKWKKTNKPDSIRSRFRASKHHSEPKKAKTPVSPGARLVSFLNNLFAAAGNPRKVKSAVAANSAAGGLRRGGDESGCSSASSYSRSCLVKTPSTRGKASPSSAGAKRSVRFGPTSVVVDDDCRACGRKYAHGIDPPVTAIGVKEAPPYYLPAAAVEERKRIGEAARELIRGYTEKVLGVNGAEVGKGVDVDEEEEDDDAWSYSSSDLFELENLAADGGGERRYLDELPVYGTTHLQVWT